MLNGAEQEFRKLYLIQALAVNKGNQCKVARQEQNNLLVFMWRLSKHKFQVRKHGLVQQPEGCSR